MLRLLDIAALYSRESAFLTLGNQVNQLAAIAYLNRMDHAFHELLRQGGAGRYMDDGYVFCSREDLLSIQQLFLASLESLGLQPNVKACFTSHLDRELAFLKIRFSCQDGHPRRRLPDHAHPISQAPQVPLLVCDLAEITFQRCQRIHRELQGRPVRLHRKAQARPRIESLVAASYISRHPRTMSENALRCPQLHTAHR